MFSENVIFHADSDGKTLAADKKKTFEKREKYEKNVRTNRTGLIRWGTGFICRRTGFICPVNEASLPAHEARLWQIKPVNWS